MTFTRRRLRSMLLTAAVIALVVWWLYWIDSGLGRMSFASGYLLYGLVVFLALLNVRKKLPTLPLGSASAWLQVHLYAGVVAGVVFGMHLGWRLPTGVFETTLATAFMMTFVSGVAGLFVSRTAPRVLSRAGQQVVYERIPQHRRWLFDNSRREVLAAVAATGSTTLADFYTERLLEFFAVRRPLGYFVRPSTRRRKRLLLEMTELERYLTSEERTACERLFALVRKKDDVDFHDARQRLLKLWLFGHITLTYVLLTLATLHGVLALAFRGDAV